MLLNFLSNQEILNLRFLYKKNAFKTSSNGNKRNFTISRINIIHLALLTFTELINGVQKIKVEYFVRRNISFLDCRIWSWDMAGLTLSGPSALFQHCFWSIAQPTILGPGPPMFFLLLCRPRPLLQVVRSFACTLVNLKYKAHRNIPR
jgi:hypothetical protein